MDVEAETKGLAFSEYFLVVATAIGLDIQRSPTFLSRLKQWQRMGLPTRKATGRGRQAAYNLEHIYQVVLAVKLMGLGISPDRVIPAIIDNWERVQSGILEVMRALAAQEAETIFGVFHPNSLGHLLANKGEIKEERWAYSGFSSDEADALSECADRPRDGVAWQSGALNAGLSLAAGQESIRNRLHSGALVDFTDLVTTITMAFGGKVQSNTNFLSEEIARWNAEQKVFRRNIWDSTRPNIARRSSYLENAAKMRRRARSVTSEVLTRAFSSSSTNSDAERELVDVDPQA